MNLLWRLAYRAVFRAARLKWRLVPSSHEGALVAAWQGDKLLLLKTSYRAQLDLPGGGVGRGEAARSAARRELREETGIDLPVEAFRFVGRRSRRLWRHIDNVSFFEAEIPADTPIRIDRREIVGFEFADAAAVPGRRDVSPLVQLYLDQLGSRRWGGPAH